MVQPSSMKYSPNSIPKPQEDISQLYPISGSNSWAIEERKGLHTGEQESCANTTPNSKNNSWVRLDEEAILVKKQAVKQTDALKSMPHGTPDNKPLPPIPGLTPSPYTPRLTPSKTQAHRLHSSFPGAFSSLNFVTRLRRHAGVKPDRVLSDLCHTQPDPKSERVTDPLIPKLWFPRKDEEVLQCQEESTSSTLYAATRPEENCYKISAQPSVANSSKVPHVLDVNLLEDENQIQLPVSDSPSKISPSPMTIANSDQSNSPVNLIHQLTSEADPTVRYLLENRLAALAISGRYRNKSGILREYGVRKPRRAGTLSETRRVQFAVTNETRRHSSQPKVIENGVCVNHQKGGNEVEKTIPGPAYSPTECSEKSIIYSKSNFSEENESNTVNSHVHFIPYLPTSVPEHNQYRSKTQPHHRPQRLVAVMPMIDESKVDTRPQLQPTSPEVRWSADSRGNSFISSSLHPSLIVAPLFEGQDRINAVPAPPASSYPDYQPMKPTPADLAQLELNLHHHINSGFSSMTRLFSDKTDRILDQLGRRLEDLEKKVGKDIKIAESQVTEVKAECANLSQEHKTILKELDMMGNCVRGLDLKLELISGNIEETRCRDHCRQGSFSGSESQNSGCAQPVPRRSQDEIAHGSPRTDHQSQAQTSSHFSQGHRSSPLGAGRSVGSNKSVLAQTEGIDRQPPDLKDHPAFTSGQSTISLTDSETTSEESGSGVKNMLPLFQTPSFRDGGWYKQAYGQ